jgi:hypothetical protein
MHWKTRCGLKRWAAFEKPSEILDKKGEKDFESDGKNQWVGPLRVSATGYDSKNWAFNWPEQDAYRNRHVHDADASFAKRSTPPTTIETPRRLTFGLSAG